MSLFFANIEGGMAIKTAGIYNDGLLLVALKFRWSG